MKFLTNVKISNILLMIIIDIVVAVLLNVAFELDSLIGLLAIIFVLLFSVSLYLIIFTLRKSASFYFLINIVISPIILYLVLLVFVVITSKLKYDERRFSFAGDDYVLFISRRSKTYSISKIFDHHENYQYGMINGDFIKRNDTTLLFNPPRYLKYYDDKLIGFPKVNDTISLKSKWL